VYFLKSGTDRGIEHAPHHPSAFPARWWTPSKRNWMKSLPKLGRRITTLEHEIGQVLHDSAWTEAAVLLETITGIGTLTLRPYW
jgi:hypothetical protein